MKVRFYLFLFISCVGTQVSFSQSVGDYLSMAADNNPSLKARYQQYLSALERVPQVGALPDPQLTFGYFVSPVETRVGPQRARFSLQQMLPWRGTLDVRRDAATREAQLRFEEFVQARNTLYFNIKQAYFRLNNIQQDMALTQENIEIMESYERLATQKYENDLASMVDILRVQMQLRNERTKLLTLRKKLAAQQVVFNKLLNRAEDAEVVLPVEVSELLMVADTASWRSQMLAENPALQILQAEAELLEEKEKLAGLSSKPNLGVGLDYVIVGQRNDMEMPDNGQDVIMPMVSLSIPLFNGHKYEAARREVQLQREGNMAATVARENELISELSLAVRDYEVALSQVRLFEEQIAATQQAISILNSAYESTSENFEDVLEFQQKLLQYQMSLNEVITQLQIARAKIEELTAVEIMDSDE
jgi:outer membrane protein TolC